VVVNKTQAPVLEPVNELTCFLIDFALFDHSDRQWILGHGIAALFCNEDDVLVPEADFLLGLYRLAKFLIPSAI